MSLSPCDFSDALSRPIRRHLGRAVARWRMIRPGESLFVGLSGGKDSLVLLVALRALQTRSPVPFSLVAGTLDPTGGRLDVSPLGELCEKLSIPYRTKSFPLFDVIRARGEASPCSFCANYRRGLLNGMAREAGCSVLALAHHLDDAVETALLNLCFSGRFRSFKPTGFQDRSGIRLIRPLVTVTEERLAQEARRLALPLVESPCPFAGQSERETMKGFIRDFRRRNPGVRENILNALESLDAQDRWEVPL